MSGGRTMSLPLAIFHTGVAFRYHIPYEFIVAKQPFSGRRPPLAKIVCTMGYTSNSARMIDRLVRAGMDRRAPSISPTAPTLNMPPSWS